MEAAAKKVGEDFVTGVVAQIKQQFSYLSQYHDNIENLSDKFETLKFRRQRIQDRVDEATRNSQDIEDDVNKWLERVEVIKAEAEGILKDEDKAGNGCWQGWCLNLKLRYQLSRKVVKEALPELDKLLAVQFETVAKPQLPLGVAQHVPKGIASSSTGTRSGLESRLLLLGDVMEAVKDDKIRIVRICGMGGVGKTTMAKEVKKMAKEQHLFDEIAMVEVNQKPDPKIIQLHIAELLGLDLKEDDVKARADRVYNRLNDERQNGKGQNDQRQNGEGQNDERPNDGGEKKRILIILDNVWKREDLEGIGIPLGDEQRCKILLTSRHDDVCKNIAPEKEFKIEVLSDPEARILFSQSLGNSPCDYDQIAEELVNACAGLPISIKAIARAVANKNRVEWTVALRKLKKSALKGEYPGVFNCLKVSYDFLKNEEIKKFFRLCCLFRKGSEVRIEDLARYGIALRLFKDINKLYEARDEAHRNVAILLNSNLLLGSDQKECVKVHDHVWDFAVSISDNGLIMVNYGDGLKEWPRRDSYEDYTSISLLCSEMNVVPEGMTLRNLELLQLTGKRYTTLRFPEKFYEGMGRVNVLAFRSMNVRLTQVSLKLLTNLRTLSLHQCSLGNDISMIGNLEKLEVLSFAYSDIKELPTVIGSLKELRLLDLMWCTELHIIAPGVLSSLISLEELYMRGVVHLWHRDNVQAMFTEIASKSKLVVIDIAIPLEVLPMDTLFEKLEKFKISINKYERGEAEYLFPNSLDLKCDSSVLLQDGIKLLVQETERMYLKVTGLKTLLDNSKTWDFSKLKSLSLVRCNELVYFINSEHNIEFRSLKYLSLKDLPNLVGFCKAQDVVEFPQLEELELNHLSSLTSIDLETETSASGHIHASSSLPFFNKKGRHTICRFQNLRSLRVNDCHSFKTAISFRELQQLEVTMCHSLQAIVAAEGREIEEEEEEEEEENAMEGRILLPELNHLHLNNLPDLSTIVPKGYTLRWSSLKKLEVLFCGTKSDIFANTNSVRGREIALTSLEELDTWRTKSTELWRNHFPGGGDFSYKLRNMEMPDCKKLLVLFSPHLVPGFHHLERLKLDNCKSLEVVFDLGELTVEGVHKFAMLNKLNSIQICDLLSMKHVWNKIPRNFEGFNNLTSLYIQKCHSLRYLFSPSIAKCLVKLQLVNVENCREMEEVVSKWYEEGQKNVVGIVFFPQLQELTLSVLPNIKCFGSNIGSTKTHHNVNANNSISSPVFNGKIALTNSEDMENRGTNSMELWRDNYAGGFSYGLRRMIVKYCHNLLVLFPNFIQVFHHLEKLDITECNTLKVVFDLEGMIAAGEHKVVILGQLYEMDLSSLLRMTHVWKKVPKDFKGFHNLISISIRYCDSLSYLFSPLIAKCLVNLVKVLVRKCKVMEEVVSKRDGKCEEDKRSAIDVMILLPKLEQLEFEDLPSLVSLGPRACAFDKQSFGAPNDGSDVTHDQGNPNSSIPTPIFNEKISLTTSMEDVEIRGTNSTELWRDQFAGRRFYYGWRRIRLNGCHKLSVLFSSHLIQGFYCLEKLQASRCDSLEVVFDLEKLMVGGGEHRVVMMNQLDQIQISYLPRMTHVWKKGPINFEGFHNLSNLEIDNCGNLKYLFSPLIAKCLVKLRKLSIEECGEMEEVVSKSWDEGKEGEEDQRNAVDIIFFPKLHELELSSLPSLVCFGPGGAPDAFDRLLEAQNVLGSTDIHHEGNFNTSISSPIFTEELPFSGRQSSHLPLSALVQIGRCQLRAWSLHNLTRVKVHECHKLLYLFPHKIVVRLPVLQHLSISNCDSMKYVFCSSTVRSLAQLRYLSIVGCKMMEVVVKEEDEVEADGWSKLVVPSLISLKLTSLPNLGGICFGMLAFEWPSLTSLEIKFCWKMRIFTSGYSSTPVLDGVLVNSNRHILEKGDLNTILTSVEQKDPDNIAFIEEGILTFNGFIVAGMYLASKCRSWYWKAGRPYRDEVSGSIYGGGSDFLITKNVPCLTRARAASSKLVEDDKNEADECGDGDDKNIPRSRTYNVSITYDVEDKIPRLWLKGFDESKRVLPPELVREDIAELHPQKFINVEIHSRLNKEQVSLYGDLTPRHIKDFSDDLAKQGFQPNVKYYLQLLLELYAPRIPTIQYCFRGA